MRAFWRLRSERLLLPAYCQLVLHSRSGRTGMSDETKRLFEEAARTVRASVDAHVARLRESRQKIAELAASLADRRLALREAEMAKLEKAIEAALPKTISVPADAETVVYKTFEGGFWPAPPPPHISDTALTINIDGQECRFRPKPDITPWQLAMLWGHDLMASDGLLDWLTANDLMKHFEVVR